MLIRALHCTWRVLYNQYIVLALIVIIIAVLEMHAFLAKMIHLLPVQWQFWKPSSVLLYSETR